jgi:hypothetical protein
VSDKPSRIIYVARYGWAFRLVPLGLGVLVLFLSPSIPGIWRSGDWFLRVGLVIVYVMAVGSFLEVFVRQTLLTEAGIQQRSLLGTVRFVPYEKIQEFIIERGERLIVKYETNRRLKIYAKEGDPEAILEAASKYVDPNTRVVTV